VGRWEVSASENAEEDLARELARIGEDGALLVQIARLIALCREMRQCGYTGQVTLNVGGGLVNSVRRDQWTDWRKRSA